MKKCKVCKMATFKVHPTRGVTIVCHCRRETEVYPMSNKGLAEEEWDRMVDGDYRICRVRMFGR